MKRVLALFSSVLLAAALAGVGGQAEAQPSAEWKAVTAYTIPDHHNIKGLKEFASLTEKATGGKLKINVVNAAEAGIKGAETLKLVKDRVWEISDILYCYGDLPILHFVYMPFLAPTIDKARMAADVWKPYVNAELEKKWNCKLLFLVPWDAQRLWGKKPIRKIEDFKGEKIRTWSAPSSDLVSRIKGSTVSMPFGEVYMAVERGIVNHFITGSSAMVMAKLYEVAKYGLLYDFSPGTSMYVVNKTAWDALSDDVKEKVNKVALEVETKYWVPAKLHEKELVTELKAKGVTIYEPDEMLLKTLHEEAKKVWEVWAAKAGPEGPGLLKKLVELNH